MKKETRTIVYDDELGIEAYRLEGIVQPFPNHFHEYYVIGLIESGERFLSCRNQDYRLKPGDMVLFHPGDNHACRQAGEAPLDYRAFNIPKEVMLRLAGEVTGVHKLPGFSVNVFVNEEAACYLRPLHEMVMTGSGEFGKDENLLFLILLLIRHYGQPFEESIPDCPDEVEKACAFMQRHFAEPISLDRLCSFSGLSKSTLLRAFTKYIGITPYRYLETVRIGEAKKLLEAGVPPVETAIQTGFSDQSHFTNYFSSFIGLTPGAYREIFLKSKIIDARAKGGANEE